MIKGIWGCWLLLSIFQVAVWLSSIIFVVILIIAVLLIVYFTTFVQQAEYKIPIHYTKSCSREPHQAHTSIEAATQQVILASLQVPSQQHLQPFLQFWVLQVMIGLWVRTAQEMLSTNISDRCCYNALLIILFTFFYTFVQINPEKAAEKLAKRQWSLHSCESVLVRELKNSCRNFFVALGYCRSIFLVWFQSADCKRCSWSFRSCCFWGNWSLIIISTGIEGIKQLEGYYWNVSMLVLWINRIKANYFA